MSSETSPTYSLYGIGGLYNYGCEAIVRGTTRMLLHINSDSNIRYFTPLSKDDGRVVKDLPIDICQLHAGNRSLPLRGINKMASLLCIPFDSTKEDYGSVLDGTDALVSIGGDIYTIPSYLRRRKHYPYFNKIVRIGQLAKSRGIPEIIIGASIGPFGEYKPAVEYYAEHFKSIDLICCREKRSIEYLSTMGVSDNVCLLPDPAFFVDDGDSTDHWSESKYLGINLSPLSLKEIHGDVSNDDEAYCSRLVMELMDITGLPAMLIPHVVSSDPFDNDRNFLQRILNAMDEAHQSRAILINSSGFLNTKRYLRRCHIVIAARMHCAVNALCEGVPTILLSYSQKSIGMCEFVYGSNRWVLPLEKADAELPNLTTDMLACADNLHAQLIRRVAEIRSDTFNSDAFARLAEVLNKTSITNVVR